MLSNVVDVLAKELGCKTEKFPIKYLGIPVGASYRSKSVLEWVLERMQVKLAIWNKLLINKVGRLVLIKSCLSSLPIYFLWGAVEGMSGITWVSWKKICTPKCCGGLGVKSLRITNKALHAKWV